MRRGGVPLYTVGLLFGTRQDPVRRGVAISGGSFATSGEGTLDSDEEFEGSIFPAGTRLNSRFRFQTFGIDALFVHDAADDPFVWRLSIGLHYLEAEARLSAATGRESEEYSDANLKFSASAECRLAPWAFVAGTVAAYTDVVSLFFGVDSGHYAGEAEISAGIQVASLRIEIGLRVFAWTLNWTESEIDLVAHGPFAGLTLHF
jgi:hypothetical protein